MPTTALLRAAGIRAYRVAVYTFAGSGGVGNVPVIRDWSGLRSTASAWAMAGIMSLATATIAFLVATAEGLADHSLIGPRSPTLPNGKNGGE